MDPAKGRVNALKAAIEMRSGIDTPEQIVARARIFENYIDAKDYPAGTQGAEPGNPEKASAGARRR